VVGRLFAGNADHRQIQVAADDASDVTERDALVGDPVQPRPRRRVFERQPVQAGRVERVDPGPAVRPVADIGGDAGVAGNADQAVGESVVVEGAVHQRRQPNDRRPHPALGQRDGCVLRVDPRSTRHRVLFGPETSRREEREQERSRGDHEGPVGADQRFAHCLDGAQICLGGSREVVEVVPEGEVDDPVGCFRRGPQAVEVVEVASARRRAGSGYGGHSLVRASQAGDLVPGFEEFGDDGGADVSGRAGDKDVHGISFLGLVGRVCIKSKTARARCPRSIPHGAMQFRHHTSSQ